MSSYFAAYSLSHASFHSQYIFGTCRRRSLPPVALNTGEIYKCRDFLWNRPLLTRDVLAIAKFRFTIKLVELHICVDRLINILDYKGNYSAKSNNTKLVHWPLMGGLLHLVQRGGAWAGCGPAQAPPRCAKCNSPPINGQCTNHCKGKGKCIYIARFL